jgi:hypothetical protein
VGEGRGLSRDAIAFDVPKKHVSRERLASSLC